MKTWTGTRLLFNHFLTHLHRLAVSRHSRHSFTLRHVETMLRCSKCWTLFDLPVTGRTKTAEGFRQPLHLKNHHKTVPTTGINTYSTFRMKGWIGLKRNTSKRRPSSTKLMLVMPIQIANTSLMPVRPVPMAHLRSANWNIPPFPSLPRLPLFPHSHSVQPVAVCQLPPVGSEALETPRAPPRSAARARNPRSLGPRPPDPSRNIEQPVSSETEQLWAPMPPSWFKGPQFPECDC